MAEIINIPSFNDIRGDLFVIEKFLSFEIKRIYFIKNGNGIRGGHKHKKTYQALVCIEGSCTISVKKAKVTSEFILEDPSKCLLLEPNDWHEMYEFSKNSILLVIASEYYDKDDYVDII